MQYLSVCSGIEAATAAWHPLGWKPLAFSEIEKFPCAVLAHHYPHVPNLGDMTKWKDWPDANVDVLVGGTPCQSFSVAGLRKGMADPRGNLALTYLAIADRYQPEWIVWENVPGVLSSSDGRDFGAFIGGLAELGYHASWRVLDAQYVRVDGYPRAVPQRRRRVFVVGHLGDWRRAAAVLFERESLLWNSAPRRQAGQRVAPTISSRPTGGGGLGTDFDCDGGLIASHDAAQPLLAKANSSHRADAESYVAHALRGEGFEASEDGTGRGTPIVAEVASTLNAAFGSKQGLEDQHINSGCPLFVTLATDGQSNAAFSNDAALSLCATNEPPYIAFSAKDYGGDAEVGLAPTLRAGWHTGSHPNAGVMPAVAFDMRGREGGSQFEGPHETANIRATSGGSSKSYVAQSWAVRRLTPRECERLQGFPDDYTAIPKAADGPRYKALGNSMAVNVMRWIGQRIDLVNSQTRS